MTEFPVSDGTIEKITCERERIFLEFLDWREERWIITFENVLGFKSVGAVGAEVSEMFVRDVTSLSQELTLIDPSEAGLNYCFTCARDCNVILTIVASGYTAEKY
ncbi:hypothetical protein JFU47_11930 [Pseudomonas sp. TH39(2020)]|jgi:hypothetical protein|uniref:hypothetical protein n=1 Tax=Pseudomonas sp. TH39(2020) TaxID=2796349 RepID=UPI0019138EBF|nr:hypothetical protein [Pseudomonas sp. TH39(2020)]MBK5397406.1 hypothetical protein [Pseudomonas sp. TH39(2020)]